MKLGHAKKNLFSPPGPKGPLLSLAAASVSFTSINWTSSSFFETTWQILMKAVLNIPYCIFHKMCVGDFDPF